MPSRPPPPTPAIPLASVDRRLFEAAARLFVDHGYAAVSVDDIAAAAGAGKQSIYRRFRTKQELFKAAITNALLGPMQEVWEKELAVCRKMQEAEESPLETLRFMCRRVLDFVRHPDALDLYRILVAEARRFPDWTAAVADGVDSWEQLVVEQLSRARKAGEIPSLDTTHTHRVLIGLVTGWVLRQDPAGRRGLEDGEVEAFFECAWRIFLHGVLAEPAS